MIFISRIQKGSSSKFQDNPRAGSLNQDIFAYINAADFNEFLEVQEDLYLRMMDVIEASGTGFAFPSQTLYMTRNQGLSKEKTAEAEAQVHQWRDNKEMQIPNFSPDRISSNATLFPILPMVRRAKAVKGRKTSDRSLLKVSLTY
ncbi:hypothetical protein CLV24_12419 [Pontibacter ummariensis]|uniref:Uncharacterized protein n=1 Tax=Pontibacter ummariensis TaxID=1610492 RepID=A0A239JYQ8_9BACT|nr:hypothetical protein [Pontibacter ummariensis]PRY07281.1 hypothetical protein CLV24_12419 [Pontibacter ummariensis]SNT10543.1 hypothetical protein SAMN06296052_12445 [Pontibacter ummariensis]